ncbi:hypothetical protein A3SI_19576 [Nitritalea halalkaliphila LW7]|uniref:Uncharacterized protein n=1 Tax=Nitritalea halalkaliphila LW7 TaxID=1189621 RepID=I5BSQ4_9BACT|nr:hypothetical protein [Nitritalea halalkaliphila]EIM72606.1 hypothetical protein A3SI_19576 [Nitritalea halalkaliphila LW7]
MKTYMLTALGLLLCLPAISSDSCLVPVEVGHYQHTTEEKKVIYQVGDKEKEISIIQEFSCTASSSAFGPSMVQYNCFPLSDIIQELSRGAFSYNLVNLQAMRSTYSIRYFYKDGRMLDKEKVFLDLMKHLDLHVDTSQKDVRYVAFSSAQAGKDQVKSPEIHREKVAGDRITIEYPKDSQLATTLERYFGGKFISKSDKILPKKIDLYMSQDPIDQLRALGYTLEPTTLQQSHFTVSRR